MKRQGGQEQNWPDEEFIRIGENSNATETSLNWKIFVRGWRGLENQDFLFHNEPSKLAVRFKRGKFKKL